MYSQRPLKAATTTPSVGRWQKQERLEVQFSAKDVADSLYRHRIRLGQGTYKTIGRWLHELVDEEFLYEGRGTDGFPVYKPHFNGVWW